VQIFSLPIFSALAPPDRSRDRRFGFLPSRVAKSRTRSRLDFLVLVLCRSCYRHSSSQTSFFSPSCLRGPFVLFVRRSTTELRLRSSPVPICCLLWILALPRPRFFALFLHPAGLFVLSPNCFGVGARSSVQQKPPVSVFLFWSWLRCVGRPRCSQRFCPSLTQSFASLEVRRAPGCLSCSVPHLPHRGRAIALLPSVCPSFFAAVWPARPGRYFLLSFYAVQARWLSCRPGGSCVSTV
jgi:hypothetical protein